MPPEQDCEVPSIVILPAISCSNLSCRDKAFTKEAKRFTYMITNHLKINLSP